MRLTAIAALLLSGVIMIGLGGALTALRGADARIQVVAFATTDDEYNRALHLMWSNGDYRWQPQFTRMDAPQPPFVGFQMPDLSADGQTMVAVGFDSNNIAQIFRLDIYSGSTEQLTPAANAVHASTPTLSPDGRWIAYVLEGAASHVWLMRSDGSGARQLTVDGVRNITPQWYPDSEHLIFARLDPENTDGMNLYRINIHTQVMRQLTFSDDVLGWPAISPDGEWLAYSRRADRSFLLSVMRTDGTDGRTLTRGERIDRYPSWSANSQQIYFATQHARTAELYRIHRDGTALTQLTDLNSFASNPSLSGVIDMPLTSGLPLGIGLGLLAGGGALLGWRNWRAA